MQGESKYFSTIVFKSLEVLAVAESDSLLKKVFIFLAGDLDSSSICSEISEAKYVFEVFAEYILSFYTKYLSRNTNTCCFKTSKYKFKCKYSKIVFKYS